MKTGIKLIDDLVGGISPDNKERVKISLARLFQDDAELYTTADIVLEDGTHVASAKRDIDPNDFSPRLRIMVPVEHYSKIEVVCDGNALDIHTETMPDGRYRMKRKLRGYTPAITEDEQTVEVKEFDSTKAFMEWIEKLPKDMVEAYRQIYYDRWNFGNGNQKDRIYYELLDEEYKGRE